MNIKDEIKGTFWNKYHKTPNPIGILLVSWIISVVVGVYIMNTQGQDVAMEKTMIIGSTGIGITIASWIYLEVKKNIKKKRGQ